MTTLQLQNFQGADREVENNKTRESTALAETRSLPLWTGKAGAGTPNLTRNARSMVRQLDELFLMKKWSLVEQKKPRKREERRKSLKWGLGGAGRYKGSIRHY